MNRSIAFVVSLAQVSKFTGTAAKYLLLGAAFFALFAWLMPTHNEPWRSFHAELAMGVAGILAATWSLCRNAERQFGLTRLALVTLLAAAVPLIQYAFGLIVFRGDASLASLYLAGFGVSQVVGFNIAERWSRVHILESMSWLFVIGALTSVWLALYQWQQLDYLWIYTASLPAGARAGANFNQPNLLATMLVLGLVGTACLFESRRIGGGVGLAITGLLGFGLAMTQSRTGVLEVAAVAALLITKRRAFGERLGVRHVLVAAAILLPMPLAWNAANTLIGDAPERSAVGMLQAGTRTIHWSSTIDAITRRPWVGYGWDQTVAASYAVSPDHPASHELLGYGHNLALDLLAWNGVPLGAVLVMALLAWFWSAMREVRDAPSVLLLACVAAVFVHALLEYPLYYAYFLLPVGLLMGAVSTIGSTKVPARVPWAVMATMIGTVTVVLGVVASDYFGLEEDIRAVRFELAHIGVDRPSHALSRPILLTHLSAFARFTRTPERRGMSDDELQQMKSVVERFPSAENLVRYSASLALNHRSASVDYVLRHVCKTNVPAVCESMERLWLALGNRYPEIAQISWPHAR